MSVVDVEVADDIASIFLNRPHRLNAVVPELIDELCGALEVAQRDGVRAVVLSGRGRAFCAGHDLKSGNEPVDAAESERRLERIQDVTRLVRRLPCPVIASVHGYALGAGCEFALCSDIVVAEESTLFGFPEVEVGLSVTGGISHILPLAIGNVRAKELLFFGERFGASRAYELGLINKVAPEGKLRATTAAIVDTLISKPTFALKLAKNGIDRGTDADLETALEREVRYTMATMTSGEARVAARAFRDEAPKDVAHGEGVGR